MDSGREPAIYPVAMESQQIAASGEGDATLTDPVADRAYADGEVNRYQGGRHPGAIEPAGAFVSWWRYERVGVGCRTGLTIRFHRGRLPCRIDRRCTGPARMYRRSWDRAPEL